MLSHYFRQFLEPTLTRNVPSQETCPSVDAFWQALSRKWKCREQLWSDATTCTTLKSTRDSRRGIETCLCTLVHASGNQRITNVLGCIMQWAKVSINSVKKKAYWYDCLVTKCSRRSIWWTLCLKYSGTHKNF